MEILSFCANRCDLCPAFVENVNKFTAEAISKGWEKYLEYYCSPEKIPCVGCQATGNHPNDFCSIRECVREKGIKNCAHCKEMPCDDLSDNIDELERLENTHKRISKKDYEMYYEPYHNRELLLKLKEMESNG
jgi:hypothetical protein